MIDEASAYAFVGGLAVGGQPLWSLRGSCGQDEADDAAGDR
jgi:hypothetical protein